VAQLMQLMQLIDSHCHLDDDRLDAEREQVIEEAAGLGVTRMILPATTANRW
jgi:TatD DNase family protein